ncbi:MAG TPA: hypothetical protein DHW71_14305 [Gammaproteobacteria bacterium]|nr:hypothetical protein [Gammaproteobacteria bacterium]HBF08206.1 hypothetical protein [Gammaproteobacteria bacterium]HCK94165.1 hypothetical protein [Gammaproteobacteria bacterium]|tara:strand:- start:1030 stop:2625 length:1596 start_codon:yes stop_codon:yes gene_type:complete
MTKIDQNASNQIQLSAAQNRNSTQDSQLQHIEPQTKGKSILAKVSNRFQSMKRHTSQQDKATAAFFENKSISTAGTRQKLIQCFTILSLLQAFYQNNGEHNLQEAINSLHDFLKDNGQQAETYSEFAKHLEAEITRTDENQAVFSSNTPTDTLQHFFAKTIEAHHLQTFINDLKKMTYLSRKTTGLDHSLIQTQDNNWYEMFQKYNIANPRDANVMLNTHQNILIPRQQTTQVNGENYKCSIYERKNEDTKISITLARNISDQQLTAVKKRLEYYDDSEGRTEANCSKNISDGIKERNPNLIFTKDYTTKKIKSGWYKSYNFIPYIAEPSLHDEINLNRLNYTPALFLNFQQRNFNTLKKFFEAVIQLEKEQLIVTDLKPDNMLGNNLIDLAGITSTKNPNVSLKYKTDIFTMPVVYKSHLSETEKSTYNRYSLGAMIFLSIVIRPPSDPKNPKELQPIKTSYFGGRPESKFYLQSQINDIPTHLYGVQMTPYTKHAIALAKTLMSKNRDIAAQVNLHQELDTLKSLSNNT